MQTHFSETRLATAQGAEAERILRSCVHCGFCTATCPTYLLTGNELDSPRGRIYLLKNILEDGKTSELSRHHLDRCLSCRSCETTCPSNVNYHRLYAIGREALSETVSSPWRRRLYASLLRRILQVPGRFRVFLGLGRIFRRLLPTRLAGQIPPRVAKGEASLFWPEARHKRRMIILNGCVQGALSPTTNAAAARVLDRAGTSLITLNDEGCCGALASHSEAFDEGRQRARALIDRLCLALDEGAEGIISSASGCGSFIHDYPALLGDDPVYREKAQRVQAQLKDLSEVVAASLLPRDLPTLAQPMRLAFHCPCSLQHGWRRQGQIEALLGAAGFELTQVEDSHLCCGSAGMYALLQPTLSEALRERKLACLEKDKPSIIVTANIGCQQHLAAASGVPVRHWIDVLDTLWQKD